MFTFVDAYDSKKSTVTMLLVPVARMLSDSQLLIEVLRVLQQECA